MTAALCSTVYPISALRATFPFNAYGVKQDSEGAA